MALTATIHGGSAGLLVSASGSFGFLGSYSSFISEQAHFGSGSFSTIGSTYLDLKTGLGDLIFTGSDTISASSSGFVFGGSSGVEFVFGTDTISLFHNNSHGNTATTPLAATQLENLFSAAAASASVLGAAAFGHTHFTAPTDLASLSGGAATHAPASEKPDITVIKLHNS